MKPLIKFITFIVIVILIASSIYAAYSLSKDETTSGDTTPPSIDSITGNTGGTTGRITSIAVSFSDDEEVTEATIFFKSANDETWTVASILSGSFNIEIPSSSDEDWYYYITVNDAAGNGPIGDPSTDGSMYYIITVTEVVEELNHTVFIEEATGETCVYCPGVSELVHDLYNSGEYNFQYVSMVVEHEKANKRLQDDYNNVGQPTLYIDGGFKVILGGGKEKEDVDASKFTEAIRTAEQRSVPAIKVTVETDYENGSGEFVTNVVVKSYEEGTYNGTLKVYLAEIISRWNYKNGKPIYHGFIDFIINEEISVEAGEEISKSEKWDLSGLDPENLIVAAVVFSSKSEVRYSFPNGLTEETKMPFNAYFADAADGTTLISGGNLPPTVGFSNPVEGMFHVFGKPLFKTILKGTRLIGKTNIVADAHDDGAIEKVEFYVNGNLVLTDDEAPYEYTLKKMGLFKSIFFRKHTIKVIAYDDTGKTATDQLEVKARL